MVGARAVVWGGGRHLGDGVQALADAVWGTVWPWELSVHMHPLHIQITLHEFGRNEHSILASQCSARPGRRASNTFFSLEAGAISSVQDILGNAEDVAWDVTEARKVVDIDQHQAILRRLYHINSIEIEAKDTPYAARQGEHFASDRDLTLDHTAVQY